jgi:hypothetical protein
VHRVPVRAVLVATGLLVAGGWLLGHSRPQDPILAPRPKFDIPTPGFMFTCPPGYICPDLTAPHTWVPTGPMEIPAVPEPKPHYPAQWVDDQEVRT